MKLVRNKKLLVIGIIQIFVSLFILVFCISTDDTTNLCYVFFMAGAGIVSLIYSISPRFLGDKNSENSEDERDIHIALKCTAIASRVMFYTLIFTMLIFGIIHIIYGSTWSLGVFISLGSCLLLFAVVYLVANIYFERKN